jgi:hypothetical protein
MTELEFLEERTPIYIDNETALAILVNNSDLKNKTFSEIFFKLRYPWINTTRGYLKDDHLMLYVNDYEIPNVNVYLFPYLFTHFPQINWVGLGCIKGNPGDIWKPRLIIRKSDNDLLSK